jgi:hypothetical protein
MSKAKGGRARASGNGGEGSHVGCRGGVDVGPWKQQRRMQGWLRERGRMGRGGGGIGGRGIGPRW